MTRLKSVPQANCNPRKATSFVVKEEVTKLIVEIFVVVDERMQDGENSIKMVILLNFFNYHSFKSITYKFSKKSHIE